MSYPDRPAVIVVSGIPRSGTSMMMRMLAAGGVSLLTDEVRTADADNPAGYFEFERAKRLRQDKAWLADATGKAVKVVSYLLPDLPAEFRYRVLLMARPLEEVVRSQRAMLARRGGSTSEEEPALRAAYAKHWNHIRDWLGTQPHMEVLELGYHDVLDDAEGAAAKVADFLGLALDIGTMAAAVDQRLYRQRLP